MKPSIRRRSATAAAGRSATQSEQRARGHFPTLAHARPLRARARVTSSSRHCQMELSAPNSGWRAASEIARTRESHRRRPALMRPGCAVITTMRSASASPRRSWVMKSTVFRFLPDAQQLVLQDRRGSARRARRTARPSAESRDRRRARAPGDALAHAARELMRVVTAEAREADQLQGGRDPLAPLAPTRRASRG